MKTTVDIPDELYQQADVEAAMKGVPVGDLIARGLRLALGKTRDLAPGRITFPLHHSARPGVLSVEQVQVAEEAAIQQEGAARAGTV